MNVRKINNNMSFGMAKLGVIKKDVEKLLADEIMAGNAVNAKSIRDSVKKIGDCYKHGEIVEDYEWEEWGNIPVYSVNRNALLSNKKPRNVQITWHRPEIKSAKSLKYIADNIEDKFFHQIRKLQHSRQDKAIERALKNHIFIQQVPLNSVAVEAKVAEELKNL